MESPDKVMPNWRDMTPDQREEEALAALAQIAFDPDAPAAARTAAAKDLRQAAVEARQRGSGGGSLDPDHMTLDEIDRELAAMQPQGTKSKVLSYLDAKKT